MDFSLNTPIIKYFNIPTELSENASICDSSGKLAFYTNGCEIYNFDHQIINNGDSLNPGITYNDYCRYDGPSRYPTRSLEIILPELNLNMFFLFHIGDNDNARPAKIYQTKIHNFNTNEYSVIEKNYQIGALKINEGIQAIRHGNGRDWWILMHESETNRFIKYLLSPHELKGPMIQVIGNQWTRQYWTAQAAFSQNGLWYSIISEYNGVNLFRFDRCTGRLSKYLSLNHPPDDHRFYPRGVCFSPNSKYLYVSAGYSIYQYDLTMPDIPNSYMLIDTIDNFILPYIFPTSFYQLVHGPDNKIYGNTSNETNVLHVIHHPDKKGKECGLKQHDILLPSTYFQSMPIFPHFRVYDWEDSPCDTLGIDKLPLAQWRYTQDTNDFLQFEFTDLTAYGVSEWFWNFGDVTSLDNRSNEQNPVHVFSQNGIYTVCLSVKNKNGADTLCKTLHIGTVEVRDETIDIVTDLFPNPAHDILFLHVKEYIPEKMVLKLYDIQGMETIIQRIYEGSNSVDLKKLKAGIYLLEIVEKGRLIKMDKLIKM
ncbi:MAG: PKD domain-containing protein [Bacteroidota bacterium]|nr:PKD domain-containing protein [Bacteroidota bacterium]